MKRYVVDRFEGLYAICENEEKEFLNIKIEDLPPETKEGDCIYINEDGIYFIDYETTEENRKRIRSKLDSLFE
jgi:translation elongation factor P/translation initiation factor 5A